MYKAKWGYFCCWYYNWLIYHNFQSPEIINMLHEVLTLESNVLHIAAYCHMPRFFFMYTNIHSPVAVRVWPVITALSNHYIVILSREVFFLCKFVIHFHEEKWKYHLQYHHQKVAINASGMYASIDITVCHLTEDNYSQTTATLPILLNYSIFSRNF